MAYSGYGAFVYKNGERRRDKEDVALFATDEETFGLDSSEIGSGGRIWANLLQRQQTGREFSLFNAIQHGVMGDGTVRVACYKQGLPSIYEMNGDNDGDVEEIDYRPSDEDIDYYDYGIIEYDYKGYHFKFISGLPYIAYMTEPDGTEWECSYDYGYGARFEGSDDDVD